MKQVKITMLLIGLLIPVFSFGQDIIIQKKGDEIKATSIEVVATEIRYKMFDDPDGIGFVIPKTDVLQIIDHNGKRTTITYDPTVYITQRPFTRIYSRQDSSITAQYSIPMNKVTKMISSNGDYMQVEYEGNTGYIWLLDPRWTNGQDNNTTNATPKPTSSIQTIAPTPPEPIIEEKKMVKFISNSSFQYFAFRGVIIGIIPCNAVEGYNTISYCVYIENNTSSDFNISPDSFKFLFSTTPDFTYKSTTDEDILTAKEAKEYGSEWSKYLTEFKTVMVNGIVIGSISKSKNTTPIIQDGYLRTNTIYAGQRLVCAFSVKTHKKMNAQKIQVQINSEDYEFWWRTNE